jgi:S1-C subfamily serine protease
LADLVLLDANPLVDIRNIMTTRAVVANGRYFDRAALDAMDPDGAKMVKRMMAYGFDPGELGVPGVRDVRTSDTANLGHPGTRGALVTKVVPNSAAMAAGIVAGDIIVTVDGEPVESAKHFRNHTRFWRVGETVTLEIISNGGARRTARAKLQPHDTDD